MTDASKEAEAPPVTPGLVAAARPRKPATINQQILFSLVGLNLLVTVLFSLTFYVKQKKAVTADLDSTIRAVAAMARENLPADYHARITGPSSVSDSDYQKIVERNNHLCVTLGLEYIWSLMMVDGRIVFTSSTSPDKVTENRKHAKFYETHSNPELYIPTFESMKPTYTVCHDKWGNIRAVLLPFYDAQGRKHLFGAGVRLDKVDGLLGGVVWQVLGLGLSFFAVSMVVGIGVTRRITRPISQLTSTIQRLAAGERDLVAEERGSYELVTLARHFNRMNRALQKKISGLEAEKEVTEEELMLSEQRYRGLLNFAVDGILIGTHEGIVVEANECMCALFRMERSEIIGKSICEMPFTPESTARVPFRYDLLQKGESVTSERSIRRSDGSEITVEMRTKMMADGTYQSIYHDITRRKMMENSLAETSRLLEEAQSISHMGGWQHDAVAKVTTWTNEVYRIYGVGYDFDVNDPARGMSFFPPEHARAILQAFTKTLEQGEPYDLEAEFIRANGERLWVRSTGHAVLENGRVVRVRGTFTDITELKRSQAQLLKSEQRYRDILNFAVDGILVCCHEGVIIEANECLCWFCGMSRSELIGRSIRELPFTPESLLKNPIRIDLVEKGELVVNERTIRRRDGSEVVVEMHTKKMPDGTHQSIWYDITERKQTEALLAETRRLLDETQRIVNVGGWAFDLTTGKASWTEEVYRIYGVGHDVDISDADFVFSFYAPEHAPRARKILTEGCASGQPFDFESGFIRANGERIWVRVIGDPVLESGQVVKVNGCIMDISGRKHAQEALKLKQEELARQNEVLTALLHNLKVGVFMVEAPSGKSLVANQEACRLLGRGVLPDANSHNLDEIYEAYQGSDRTRRYPADEMPIMLGMKGVSAHVEDLVVVRPDGTESLLEVFGTPVKDEQGRIWASLVSFIDITERQRVERELRESQERYRQLFEMESDALLLIDNTTGKILDVNLSAQTLYGYSRDELLSKRNSDLSAEPEQTKEATQKAVKEQPNLIRIALRRHRKSDGSVFPVEIAARSFTMDGRTVHIAAIRDITERRKAQELLESWNVALERRVADRTAAAETHARQLQRLTGQLIRAEERERQRISDVLHEDLQQTLVAARMTLGVAVEPVRSLVAQESIKRVDEMLSRSIRLTRTLVQEIAVPGVKEAHLSAAIGWIAQQMRDKFGLNVALTVGDGLAPVGENSYLCLYRALQEILFNVVKHAQVQHAEVTIQQIDGQSVRLTVKDRGCGVPADDVAAARAGTGVGLYAIRERVNGLGGQMEIVSSAGEGTAITITLPSHDVQPETV